jgi:hypothetical protein
VTLGQLTIRYMWRLLSAAVRTGFDCKDCTGSWKKARGGIADEE